MTKQRAKQIIDESYTRQHNAEWVNEIPNIATREELKEIDAMAQEREFCGRGGILQMIAHETL